jgi:DNA polymerase I-like protein with 3'-5' exonuclease and polymerase domains
LPQSAAADIIFRAMLNLVLPKPARLLLQVHDSLVLEAPGDLVEEVKAHLKEVMERPIPELNGLVIPVSIKVGNNWLGE